MSAVGKLRFMEGGKLAFKCPGCQIFHMLNYGEGHGPRWAWSGGAEAPTFRPSVLVQYNTEPGSTRAPKVCHSFVTDGWIEFLADSTHALSGQKVELPNVEDGQ
jgi:hypothetical protein